MKSFRWSLFFFRGFFYSFFLSSSFRNLRVMKKKNSWRRCTSKKIDCSRKTYFVFGLPWFSFFNFKPKEEGGRGPFFATLFWCWMGDMMATTLKFAFYLHLYLEEVSIFSLPKWKKERPKKKTKQEKKQHKKESEKRGRCSTKTPVYEVISPM